MIRAPHIANDQERLVALNSLAIMNTPSEERFDRIVLAAAHALDMPAAMINFVDGHRVWTKAAWGINRGDIPRANGFCSHAILDSSPFLVADAGRDERFLDNPLVIAAPRTRAYLGIPLSVEGRHQLGTLCVVSHVAQSFGSARIRLLESLAKAVVRELRLGQLLIENGLQDLLEQAEAEPLVEGPITPGNENDLQPVESFEW